MLFGIWEIFNNKTILPPFPIISLFLLPTSKWCNSTAREKQLLEVWVYFMRFGEGDLFFLLNLKTSPQTQIWDWFWKRAGQPGPFCSQWFVAHIPEALPPPLPPACSKFSNGLLMSSEWSPRQPAALQHPAPGFSPACWISVFSYYVPCVLRQGSSQVSSSAWLIVIPHLPSDLSSRCFFKDICSDPFCGVCVGLILCSIPTVPRTRDQYIFINSQ